MNLLIIILVGVSIIWLDESPKDLPTIVEDSLICEPADEGWCIGWKKE